MTDLANTHWWGSVNGDDSNSYEMQVRLKDDKTAAFKVLRRDGEWSPWTGDWTWSDRGGRVWFGRVGDYVCEGHIDGGALVGRGATLGKGFSFRLARVRNP